MLNQLEENQSIKKFTTGNIGLHLALVQFKIFLYGIRGGGREVQSATRWIGSPVLESLRAPSFLALADSCVCLLVVSIDFFCSQIVCFGTMVYIGLIQCFLFVTSQLIKNVQWRVYVLKRDKKIISQFLSDQGAVAIGNGDRVSMKDRKYQYLHEVQLKQPFSY